MAQITKKNANVVINKNFQNCKHFDIDLAHFYLVYQIHIWLYKTVIAKQPLVIYVTFFRPKVILKIFRLLESKIFRIFKIHKHNRLVQALEEWNVNFFFTNYSRNSSFMDMRQGQVLYDCENVYTVPWNSTITIVR